MTTPTGANGLERWRGAAFAAGNVATLSPPCAAEVMTRTTCYSAFVEQDWGLTGEEAGLREGLEEGESDVDADPVPQLRQSIMSNSSGIGNSRILAKSVPIVNSMVGGLGVFGGVAGCLGAWQGVWGAWQGVWRHCREVLWVGHVCMAGGPCLHGRWAMSAWQVGHVCMAGGTCLHGRWDMSAWQVGHVCMAGGTCLHGR